MESFVTPKSIPETNGRWDYRRNPKLRRDPNLPYYDPEWNARCESLKQATMTQESEAFRTASWYVMINRPPDNGPVHPSKIEVTDPVRMTRRIKQVARFLGAQQVGVTELNQHWVMSFGNMLNSEKRIDLSAHRYTIVVMHEMDYEMYRSAPSPDTAAATGEGYSKMTYITNRLAAYIRGLGYLAESHMTGEVLSIPSAIEAGLGQQGRHGMLIHPHYGPRLRLDTVTTDLPLAPDAPADIGAQEFCERCLRCARHCPQQAITHDDMTDIAPTKSNRSGIKRWIINAERCYIGRDINPYKSCGVCIRVCPWNKPNVWYHRLSVAALQRWRWARPALITLLLWLEDVFGYGKKQNWRNPLAEQRRLGALRSSVR